VLESESNARAVVLVGAMVPDGCQSLELVSLAAMRRPRGDHNGPAELILDGERLANVTISLHGWIDMIPDRWPHARTRWRSKRY
jgi:hypothetical protein